MVGGSGVATNNGNSSAFGPFRSLSVSFGLLPEQPKFLAQENMCQTKWYEASLSTDKGGRLNKTEAARTPG